MKVYKLTDENDKTYGNTQWGKQVRHVAAEREQRELCTSSVIHAYRDRYLAALVNPIHANFKDLQCWISEGEGDPLDDRALQGVVHDDRGGGRGDASRTSDLARHRMRPLSGVPASEARPCISGC